MSIHQETPFQKALEAIESLPNDAQEEIIDIIKKRLAEDRREEIAANANEAVMAIREGRAKYGNINDIKMRHPMTRLQIKIKEADKAIIVLNLLKELPFVEIEKSEEEEDIKAISKEKNSLEDLFGLWENRSISFQEIREKAWVRNNDTV